VGTGNPSLETVRLNIGEREMGKQITLYRDDLNPNSVLTWEGLLENLGIDSDVIVGGKSVSRDIEGVTIFVSGTELTDYVKVYRNPSDEVQ